MKLIHVYCMPGMAASPKIFEFIDIKNPFKFHFLSWFSPNRKETLSQYAGRMCERVEFDNPILLGVSFGGVLVQEMAKHIKVSQVVIISSIKTNLELPLSMRMAQKTNAHKLLPTQWINNIDALALFTFGKGIQKRLELYQKYLSERNSEYLDWAIDALVNWDHSELNESVIHIHGNKDSVFTVKNICKPFIKISGGHAIIITQANWFNQNLPNILLKNV